MVLHRFAEYKGDVSDNDSTLHVAVLVANAQNRPPQEVETARKEMKEAKEVMRKHFLVLANKQTKAQDFHPKLEGKYQPVAIDKALQTRRSSVIREVTKKHGPNGENWRVWISSPFMQRWGAS